MYKRELEDSFLKQLTFLPVIEQCWIVCPINETIPYKNGVTIGGVRQVIEFFRKQ